MKKLLVIMAILILGEIPVWCNTTSPYQKPSELVFSDLSTISNTDKPTLVELQVEDNKIIQEEQDLQEGQNILANWITITIFLVGICLACLLVWILRNA